MNLVCDIACIFAVALLLILAAWVWEQFENPHNEIVWVTLVKQFLKDMKGK